MRKLIEEKQFSRKLPWRIQSVAQVDSNAIYLPLKMAERTQEVPEH